MQVATLTSRVIIGKQSAVVGQTHRFSSVIDCAPSRLPNRHSTPAASSYLLSGSYERRNSILLTVPLIKMCSMFVCEFLLVGIASNVTQRKWVPDHALIARLFTDENRDKPNGNAYLHMTKVHSLLHSEYTNPQAK